MSAIINIGSLSQAPSTMMRTQVVPAPSERFSDNATNESDSVELSRFGRALARAVDLSSFSVARTRAIRAQIESGTYETPERINGTVARLLDVIG